MQFKSFHWLSHHGMSHYTILYKFGNRARNFWGVFLPYFSFLSTRAC